ncbi:hypothetical protein NDU88_004795 [Pleurodeles waltl]|uniref:Uncharacterized protein n=1 Tax=Pleurodeles waltl TaxID=8319 RepID=A0AAV7TTL2_PLEWA|nr:hypothetical protein NDU88_004795 [Pleurodeles waltl]
MTSKRFVRSVGFLASLASNIGFCDNKAVDLSILPGLTVVEMMVMCKDTMLKVGQGTKKEDYEKALEA